MTKKKTTPKEIIAFKAFDRDMSCRGFKYEVGKTYTHNGNVSICDSGFHSCTDPLDVLNYYDITTSRFAIVKASGEISQKTDGDTKLASASITIDAELLLPEFIARSIDWIKQACKTSVDGNASSGRYAKNASSGYSAKNASSGYHAKNASSGYYATNASSGDHATNASSGDCAKNAATGKNAVIAAAGLHSKAKGEIGVAIAQSYEDKKGQIRFATGVIGEDGLLPDVWYKAENGKLVAS